MAKGTSKRKMPSNPSRAAKRTRRNKRSENRDCVAPDRPHVEINGRCMIFDNLAPSGLPPAHGRSAQEEVPANDRKPDGASPVLQWDRAPIKTYRARYVNELAKRGNCRGALEDETGDGCPSLQLAGVNSAAPAAVQVDVYAATSDGEPHPYFYCTTAGKDSPTCCHATKLENNCPAVRFTARRKENYRVLLKHVGIVRLRKDAVSKMHAAGNQSLATSQTNYFHLKAIPVTYPAGSTLSEAIKCISSTQAVSNPVVTHILTLAGSSWETPEVVIVGKDFGPSTHFRIFQEQVGDRDTWQVTVPPEEYKMLGSHSGTIRLQMPCLPRELLKRNKGGELVVLVDAAPNTTRRATKSIPLNRKKAVEYTYPADPKKHPDPSASVRYSECCCSTRMPQPTTSKAPTRPGNIYQLGTGIIANMLPTPATESYIAEAGQVHSLFRNKSHLEDMDASPLPLAFAEAKTYLHPPTPTLAQTLAPLPAMPPTTAGYSNATSQYARSQLPFDVHGMHAMTPGINQALLRSSVAPTPAKTWYNIIDSLAEGCFIANGLDSHGSISEASDLTDGDTF